MTSRTTAVTVAFAHPFKFRNMDEERPAGSYSVEIDEELLESLSFAAYRRTGAWIRLPPGPGGSGAEQLVPIEPDEMDESLETAIAARVSIDLR